MAAKWLQTFALSTFVLGLILFGLLGVFVTQVVGNLITYGQVFTKSAGRSPVSIGAEVWSGVRAEPKQEPLRWLLLGKDEVPGSGRQAVLTDTMMVVSYNPDDHVVRLLSLQRDIYHPGLATKINSLYSYGAERNPARPELFVSQTLTEMFGFSFDGVVAISLEDMRELIDTLGGIDVDVERTFTDEMFPRGDVDVTKERDPKKLYETVHFEAGMQRMDGERALKYMRSRHSTDLAEGNDEARARRQQRVIHAIIEKFNRAELYRDPARLGQLYRWYADRFMSQVSLHEVGHIGSTVLRGGSLPEMRAIELPVLAAPRATESATLFIHPPTEKYKQWVYEPIDPTWRQLQEFMKTNAF